RHLERDFRKGQGQESRSVFIVPGEEGPRRPVGARRDLTFTGGAERRPRGQLLRAEEELVGAADEIAERLNERAFENDHPKSVRLRLDHSRLLANAVRDRIDPKPWARIQALLEALEGLRTTIPQTGLHERVALFGAIQKLRRICRGKLSPSP